MKFPNWKARLTPTPAGANTLPMDREERQIASQGILAAGAAVLALSALGGCINVNAPSEPIVIELNVNIKQEVLYRLVDSATENIEENPEIF